MRDEVTVCGWYLTERPTAGRHTYINTTHGFQAALRGVGRAGIESLLDLTGIPLERDSSIFEDGETEGL